MINVKLESCDHSADTKNPFFQNVFISIMRQGSFFYDHRSLCNNIKLVILCYFSILYFFFNKNTLFSPLIINWEAYYALSRSFSASFLKSDHSLRFKRKQNYSRFVEFPCITASASAALFI